jgi:hypothetical protein
MPFGDRTGPYGTGPMTGRAAGFCAGYDRPGYANPGPAWRNRMGRGRGYGHGWRHWYHATGLPFWARAGYGPAPQPFGWRGAYGPPTPDQEVEMLKSQAGWLRNELEAIEARISDLEQESS